MNIPKTATLVEVRCNATNKKMRRCGRFLGRFQADTANTYGDFTCASCKALTQLFVDEFGILHKDIIHEAKIIDIPVVSAYIGRK